MWDSRHPVQNMRAQAEGSGEVTTDCEDSVRAVVKRRVWELTIVLVVKALEAVTRQ
jgi:hypothetical protein